jgi:hypothetical protein
MMVSSAWCRAAAVSLRRAQGALCCQAVPLVPARVCLHPVEMAVVYAA